MKEKFPIFQHQPDLIYLDSAATAHKPSEVIEALSHFYAAEYATVHRSAYQSSLSATQNYNEARETAQKFLNAAHPDEIVFTRGTTDGLNLVARSFGQAVLKKGDEIALPQIEHHSNLVPWQMIAEATGAKLRWIEVDDAGNLLWEKALSPRTKIVTLAHVSNVTGTIYPIAAIGKAAHALGAYLVVDGAQAAPHMPVDVQALDCDFYAFSGHKCYGPTGIGILYGKASLLEKMAPLQGGGDMIEKVEWAQTSYQKPPLRFEAGTPNIASVIGLKAALEFIEEIGRETMAAHGQKLLAHAMKLFSHLPKVRVLGTAPQKGPILTFVVENVHPLDIATFLDLKSIAIRTGHLCAQPALKRFNVDSVARISFGIYTTVEDLNLFADALDQAIQLLSNAPV